MLPLKRISDLLRISAESHRKLRAGTASAEQAKMIRRVAAIRHARCLTQSGISEFKDQVLNKGRCGSARFLSARESRSSVETRIAPRYRVAKPAKIRPWRRQDQLHHSRRSPQPEHAIEMSDLVRVPAEFILIVPEDRLNAAMPSCLAQGMTESALRSHLVACGRARRLRIVSDVHQGKFCFKLTHLAPALDHQVRRSCAQLRGIFSKPAGIIMSRVIAAAFATALVAIVAPDRRFRRLLFLLPAAALLRSAIRAAGRRSG